MDSVFSKIVDKLPFPIIIAIGVILMSALSIKYYYSWKALFYNKIFKSVLIITFVGLPVYYLCFNKKVIKENQKSNKEFYIDSLISGHMTPFDLISSTSIIEFVTDVGTVNTKRTLFLISYEDFIFSLSFDNGTIVLNRCNHILKKEIKATNPSEKLKIRIVTEPNQIGLLVGDKTLFEQLSNITDNNQKDNFLLSKYKTLRFSPIYPPNSILKWVRKENLISVNEYKSYSILVDAVISIFASLESKIESSSMYAAFWDKNKENISTPKKEAEIYKTLVGLIQDECILKSLDISYEKTEDDNLNFYISGHILNEGIKGVCIEVICAHSPNLERGITHQLPTYMRYCGADFGLYLVLWFKNNSFSEPSKYENLHVMEDDVHRFRNELGYGRMIRILTLNLSGI